MRLSLVLLLMSLAAPARADPLDTFRALCVDTKFDPGAIAASADGAGFRSDPDAAPRPGVARAQTWELFTDGVKQHELQTWTGTTLDRPARMCMLAGIGDERAIRKAFTRAYALKSSDKAQGVQVPDVDAWQKRWNGRDYYLEFRVAGTFGPNAFYALTIGLLGDA